MIDEKRDFAIKLLCEKSRELGRTPKRVDFNSDEVCLIKQKLGPWPRALEVAGLKECTKISSYEKNKLKREQARKRNKLLNSENN